MKILREPKEKYKINSPEDVFAFLEEFREEDREHFIVIGLDTRKNVIYREICAIGINNKTIIHQREIFRRAIIDSVDSIIIAHNHPSGELKPSEEDEKITQTLENGALLLGITLLDHIIVSREGFKSIKY